MHPSNSPRSVADTDLGIGTCPRCRSQEVRDVPAAVSVSGNAHRGIVRCRSCAYMVPAQPWG